MLQYTSVLKAHYQDALEKLMFFNPGQKNALLSIMESIESFGNPCVVLDGDNLRVKVDKLDEVQSLFALDGNTLVGVIIYSRTDNSCFCVLHIAVEESYSNNGIHANKLLVPRLINVVRNSAARVKDVEIVRVIDNNRQVKDYPVIKKQK